MVFNSFQFLWLFPIIFLLYYGIVNLPCVSDEVKHKLANLSLIIASYGLYLQWKPTYALILLGVTAITYLSAIIIERKENKRKYLIVAFTLLALLPLLVFKYYNFINSSIRSLLESFGIAMSLPGLNWAIPLGISFFTFIAIGYLFDVYYKRIPAEKNFLDYMLFVSFFPQILSGPISKAKDLLPQIKANRKFDYYQAVTGLKFLLWGMFLKVVMADRLGIYVDEVFGHWMSCSGITCLLASFFYTFQIYGDFAGYSFMAVGVGKLMGFNLINNFNRPYLSVSITDFWHRWHISFSIWLKDYVYIPLGGSRCSRIRNYWNIIVTFLVSGIWHGANWTFVVWGLLHGVFQVIEKALGLQKCESRSLFVRLPRIFITFIIISFLWTIFRMPTISSGVNIIAKMFTQFNPLTLTVPLGYRNAMFILMSIGIVMVSEYMQEFAPSRFSMISNQRRAVRWFTYIALILFILLTGVLDGTQFIYSIF